MRRAVAGPLSALVLCLSVVGPVLERGELANEPVVESQHDPSACAPAHDHTLCAQAGANLPVSPGPELLEGYRPVLAAGVHRETRWGPSSGVTRGHPTRAPPIV